MSKPQTTQGHTTSALRILHHPQKKWCKFLQPGKDYDLV